MKREDEQGYKPWYIQTSYLPTRDISKNVYFKGRLDNVQPEKKTEALQLAMSNLLN